MARESKKHKDEAPQEPKPLEQLILNQSHGKYQIVSMASVWALELRRREELRHLTQNEILDLALHEMLSGKVTAEQVRHAAAEAAKAAAALADGKK